MKFGEKKKQHGAAEARRAHNPEDSGSKPDAANSIFNFLPFCPRPSSASKDLMKNSHFFLFVTCFSRW